jgi:hypothetical protein
MVGLEYEMRWEHREVKPMLQVVPLLAVALWVLGTAVATLMVWGTDHVRLIPSFMVLLGIVAIVTILLGRYFTRRIQDDLHRCYRASFEEVSARIHNALTEADIRYTHFTRAEYKKNGSINSIFIAGHLMREPSSVFEMDGPSAVIMEQMRGMKGHCEVCLYPYEGEMVSFLNRISTIIDGAFAP